MSLITAYVSPYASVISTSSFLVFLTQFGYSPCYPNKFGVENWSSIIAQETMNAQCEWWQHPENNCPESPAQVDGDCSHPNCDVVEFYQQVLITRAGMQPGWFGINFPNSSNELEELLSDQMKGLIELLKQVDHQSTHSSIKAERNVLKVLEGDCETAVGAISEINNENITLKGELLSLDGKQRYYCKSSKDIKYAAELGIEIGENLKKQSKGSYKK